MPEVFGDLDRSRHVFAYALLVDHVMRAQHLGVLMMRVRFPWPRTHLAMRSECDFERALGVVNLPEDTVKHCDRSSERTRAGLGWCQRRQVRVRKHAIEQRRGEIRIVQLTDDIREHGKCEHVVVAAGRDDCVVSRRARLDDRAGTIELAIEGEQPREECPEVRIPRVCLSAALQLVEEVGDAALFRNEESKLREIRRVGVEFE